MKDDQGFAARVEQCIANSAALPARLEECLLTSDVFWGSLHNTLIESPNLAARFYPHQFGDTSYCIPKVDAGHSPRHDPGLPVPPEHLWFYGSSLDEWLEMGQMDMDNLRAILDEAGFAFTPGQRILEFGCATGRLMRWLYDLADTCEIWGVDITAESILWCQQHLSPPFRFATTTTLPHLPFEDRSFDLIYTGSVFTHIADLAEMWLLELRRILKPGGLLYATVFDSSSIDIMMRNPNADPEWYRFISEFEKERGYMASDFAMFTINRTPGVGSYTEAQTFYDTAFLRQHWGQYFEVLSVTPLAFVECQTGVLLRK